MRRELTDLLHRYLRHSTYYENPCMAPTKPGEKKQRAKLTSVQKAERLENNIKFRQRVAGLRTYIADDIKDIADKFDRCVLWYYLAMEGSFERVYTEQLSQYPLRYMET